MKIFKTLLVTLVAFLLSGCYTQLQYSQTMKKITDEKKGEESKVYSWNGDEQTEAAQTRGDEDYSEYTEEDYIPISYKDYNYERRYEECGCNPYNVYNFYGSDWYGYDDYYSYYRPWGMSPFHYQRWYHPYYRGFHHPRFAFSFSFGWGSPFYYHRFYDPFYDPFFDYYHYRYGFYRPYASTFYFYGKSGYGQGIYDSDDQKRKQNVRYGPRSIGTDRVNSSGNRSRDTVNGRRDATVTKSPTVRTRSSVGTTRTRSSSDRNTVNRTRSENNRSDGNSRSRSRDNEQSNNNNRSSIDRTHDGQTSAVKSDDRTRTVRSRTIIRRNSVSNMPRVRNNLRNVEPPKSRVEKSDRNRRTFFNRMKGFFQDNTSRIINNNGSNRTIRSRSSSNTNRSAVKRSNNSSSRSSVTRSRSSSNNDTRSRGNSSSSRSRSNDSGGSDRSRDR